MVAYVGSFAYLSSNPTRKRPEAATAHTGERYPAQFHRSESRSRKVLAQPPKIRVSGEGGKPASEALRVRTWNRSRALTGIRPNFRFSTIWQRRSHPARPIIPLAVRSAGKKDLNGDQVLLNLACHEPLRPAPFPFVLPVDHAFRRCADRTWRRSLFDQPRESTSRSDRGTHAFDRSCRAAGAGCDQRSGQVDPVAFRLQPFC